MTTTGPDSRPVRVRIAPSPTGDPHVGTAYIALFNYVFARHSGGKFVLRIDDTDRTRSRRSSEEAILRALRWLGLEWDEGPDVGGPHAPYRQSERGDHYAKYAKVLLDSGHAYRCFATPEELETLREERKAQGRQEGFRSPYRGLDLAESARRAEAGEAHVIRLKVPSGESTRYRDRLRGEIEFHHAQVDDQVLLKSDGMPTYHLASVVDDYLMQITHVIRAEEWISSTPKHVLLHEAFGWPQPEWIHMPLLRNTDKSKISKRKNPVSLDYYADAGIMPEALLNFLGIMGWSFGGDREKFNLDEMIEVFSFDRVSLGGPVFDQEKLRWMNEQYLKELSYEELADRLLQWRFARDHLLRVMPLIRERIKRFDEFIPAADFFFSGDLDYTAVGDKLAIPEVKPSQLRKSLDELVERYEALPEFTAEALEEASRAFADEKQWKTKHLFMVLRLVVTGRKASPPLFDTMAVLGKELTRRRMRTAGDYLKTRK